VSRVRRGRGRLFVDFRSLLLQQRIPRGKKSVSIMIAVPDDGGRWICLCSKTSCATRREFADSFHSLAGIEKLRFDC